METLSGELRQEVVEAKEKFVSLLEREPVLAREEIPEIDRDRLGFAEECEDLLGHSDFLANLDKERRDEIAAVSVRNALYELGVVPYKTESVKKYQKAVLEKIRGKPTFFLRHEGALTVSSFLSAFVLVLCALAVFATLIAYPSVPWWVGVVALVASIPFFFLARHLDRLEDRVSIGWRYNRISWYSGAIPESVLRTAVAIKKRLPAANLWVESIGEGKDPFLGVSHRGHEFYVDVWDEPDFQAQAHQE